jgi:hypothetical protein
LQENEIACIMKSLCKTVRTWRIVGIIIFASVSLMLAACQNTETSGTQQEQLDNNGPGMDQDHTAAPPDTMAITSDSIQPASKQAVADSTQRR